MYLLDLFFRAVLCVFLSWLLYMKQIYMKTTDSSWMKVVNLVFFFFFFFFSKVLCSLLLDENLWPIHKTKCPTKGEKKIQHERTQVPTNKESLKENKSLEEQEQIKYSNSWVTRSDIKYGEVWNTWKNDDLEKPSPTTTKYYFSWNKYMKTNGLLLDEK